MRSYDGIDIDTSVNATISNDSFTNLRYGVNASGPIWLAINNNTFTTDSEGVNIGIDGSTITGLTVNNNTVTSPTGDGLYIDLPYNGPNIVFIENNTVSGSPYDGIFEFGAAVVSGNTVSKSAVGLEIEGGDSGSPAVATGNTVTGSTTEGVEIDGTGATVFRGNTISGNAIGIYNNANSTLTTISNNLLLNNTSIAINNNGTGSILNNTFVQADGTAIQNIYTSPIIIENNIFQMSGGTVFNVPAADQAGFSSNYNLFDLLPDSKSVAATMANWAGLTVPDFASWMLQTGYDIDSLTGDPQFTNAAAGNYFLMPTSPGIDAGDPGTPYSLEPGNNGGRINLGLEGNTLNATQSAAVTVQVTSPAGLTKLQEGTPTTITYRTSGVTGLEIVTQENFGGVAITSANPEGDFIAVPTSYSTASTSTINMTGVSGTAPAQVYQTEIYASSGAGQKLVTSVAAADGTYQVTLNFAEIYGMTVGGRVFNININGVTVATNFDVYKLAGSQVNKAVNATFTVTTSGGTGITIELDNLTSNPAILSGIEVDKVTAQAASQIATVQVSPDGGMTWETVSTTAPIDAYGNGSVSWTPNFTTTGNTALVRVIANGVTGVSQGFLVANGGNDYYINSSTSSGGQYTTAPGSDLNSGKSPDAPIADLTALLHSYTLAPGDVVFIDAGTYQMLTDALIGAADSGVTFQGPTTGTATLNRDNVNGYVFQLNGASNVTITDLTLTGAYCGIVLDTNTNSNNVTISNDIIENNQTYGVYVGTANNNVTIEGSEIFGSVNGVRDYGIYLNFGSSTQDTATIINNEIFGQYAAIEDYLDGGLIQGNSIHDNIGYGLYLEDYNSTAYPTLTVTANNIFNNGNSSTGNYGVYAYGTDVVVTGNAIYGQTASSDIGLFLTQGVVATGNTIYDNYDGVYLNDNTVTVTGNRIFVNTNAGVLIGVNGGTIEDNDIYSNATGVLSSGVGQPGGYFNIQNNLIYANTTEALNLSGGGSGPGNSIIGNTIWQSVGTSIGLSGSAVNTTIADNIVWGDEGTIISVASNSASGLQVLYNLYYRGSSGAATLASIGSSSYTTLAAWLVAQPTLNAGSIEGNPDFIKIAGADGVLGGPDTALGGGLDDDFTPGKGSPAIDASDAFPQSPTDMLGQSRQDDPATPNTGIGLPVYDATSTGTTNTLPAGVLQSGGYLYAGNYLTYTLSSPFTFYGIELCEDLHQPDRRDLLQHGCGRQCSARRRAFARQSRSDADDRTFLGGFGHRLSRQRRNLHRHLGRRLRDHSLRRNADIGQQLNSGRRFRRASGTERRQHPIRLWRESKWHRSGDRRFRGRQGLLHRRVQ